MREIHGHEINECNEQIFIRADERNQNGNASHLYTISVGRGNDVLDIRFQDGPIKEVGVNGITQEALLAILIDRLECFQDSVYKCQENADALEYIKCARDALHDRAKARRARGVEGTHAV